MKKKTKASARKKSTKTKAAAPTVVQQALQVTWVLKGKLKSAQIAYFRIGELLAEVRDDNLFSVLKHTTIEDYAQRRLSLGRASLYRYLQVYDWVRVAHPAWLQPKPKGFIPYFTDATDLMWIEHTLADGTLTREARTELEALKAKALAGTLKDGEVDKWRKKGGRASDGLKTFLSKVRLLRRRSAEIKDMPAEAVKLMDDLIEIVDHAVDGQPLK